MPPEEDDEDRAAILARRRRWIALALAGATATVAASCRPCLSPTHDSGPRDAGADATTDADDHD